jgi:hypothetical protein
MMDVPLAQPVHSAPLTYAHVTPEAKQHRVVVFVARIIAMATIFAAAPSLATVLARLVAADGSYGFNFASSYSYYYGGPTSPALMIAHGVLVWVNGIASMMCVIAAIGTMIRRNAMRFLLASFLALLGAGVLARFVVESWSVWVYAFAPAPWNGKLMVLVEMLPGITPAIFPIAASAILWHPAFREINRFEDEHALPDGAYTICFVSVVVAVIGLISRPLILIASMALRAADETAPLGISALAGASPLWIWHVMTRVVLTGCSLALLIGSIRLLRGRLDGRRLMVRQAQIAVIVNGVEIALLLVLFVRLGNVLTVLTGAVNHWVTILPGLILDLVIWFYFSMPSTKQRLTSRLA